LTDIDPATVVPAGADPVIVEALTAVEKAEKIVAELGSRISAREQAFASAAERENVAALLAEGGNQEGQKHYAAEVAARKQAEAELERARSALIAAQAGLRQARTTYHVLTVATRVARFKRLAVQREKAAAALQETGEAYGRALAAFEASIRKMSDAYGATGARQFGCHLLGPEVAALLPWIEQPSKSISRAFEVQYALTGNFPPKELEQ
jgi:hypothetical protein